MADRPAMLGRIWDAQRHRFGALEFQILRPLCSCCGRRGVFELSVDASRQSLQSLHGAGQRRQPVCQVGTHRVHAQLRRSSTQVGTEVEPPLAIHSMSALRAPNRGILTAAAHRNGGPAGYIWRTVKPKTTLRGTCSSTVAVQARNPGLEEATCTPSVGSGRGKRQLHAANVGRHWFSCLQGSARSSQQQVRPATLHARLAHRLPVVARCPRRLRSAPATSGLPNRWPEARWFAAAWLPRHRACQVPRSSAGQRPHAGPNHQIHEGTNPPTCIVSSVPVPARLTSTRPVSPPAAAPARHP